MPYPLTPERLLFLKRQLGAALRSLRRRKLRSALSVTGVICGVMAVLAMAAAGEGARREAMEGIEAMGTRNIFIRDLPATDGRPEGRSALPLSTADLQRIRASSALVREAAGMRVIRAEILATGRKTAAEIVACDAAFLRLLNLQIASGRMIGAADLSHRNLVCVLGEELAKRLGRDGITGGLLRIGPLAFRIVGVLGRHATLRKEGATVAARNYNEMLFIPLGTHRDLVGAAEEVEAGEMLLSEVVATVARVETVPDTARTLHRVLEARRGHPPAVQFVLPLELLRQLQRTRAIFNLVLGTVAGISLLVGGVGVMNIMLATVTERRREIGIRRALGATRRQILLQFLLEAVLLTFAGGILGLLTGSVAVLAIAAFAGWPVVISAWALVLPLLVAAITGIASGLYPAVQAARLDPVRALRYE